jgi:hypothetical protein
MNSNWSKMPDNLVSMHPILKAPQAANIASARTDIEKSTSIPGRYRGHPFLAVSMRYFSHAGLPGDGQSDQYPRLDRQEHSFLYGDHWSALLHLYAGMERIIGQNSMKRLPEKLTSSDQAVVTFVRHPRTISPI